MGKRVQASSSSRTASTTGVEGCNYLLALEMEMDPVPGYALASWDQGYGDFRLEPVDGTDVASSPRQVLKAQVARAEALGNTAMFGSELEFFLFKESYEEAHAKHYRDLTPSVPYILDYHILAATYDEPLIRQIRNGMQGAGIRVVTSKGEAWPGQHEINFRYEDAVSMADNHVIYKNGAKEIPHLNGRSITFMAKPDHTWIGSSFHIHSSLWANGKNAFEGESDVFKQYLAGQIADDQLVQALRRRQLGADDARAGPRQPDLRFPGRRPRPGAADRDADPRWRRQPVPGVRGAARGRPARDRERARAAAAPRGERIRIRRRALPAFTARGDRHARGGLGRRAALGDEVIDHYLNYARTEQRLFDES